MSVRELPPLAAIRVFDAAARHGNFTSAAVELAMTQAAVSYQIKILEERVGAPLFVRRARGVELSPLGIMFAQRIGSALDMIADAYADARGATQGVLAISVAPTFATNFLAQRLGRFQVAHPELSVRIEVGESITDFRTSEIDVAIRGGRGGWAGLICHRLLDIKYTPMLSPKLAASVGGVTKPEDLLKLSILAHGYPWWSKWFEAAGVEYVEPPSSHAPQFGPQVLEGNAAIAGEGIAMLMPALFTEALALGHLVQPFDLTCTDEDNAIWLVYPESRRNAPKVKAFKSWLTAEVATVGTG